MAYVTLSLLCLWLVMSSTVQHTAALIVTQAYLSLCAIQTFSPWEGVLLGVNLGRAIVHRDLLGIRMLQRRDAALLPNYFVQTCYDYYTASSVPCVGHARQITAVIIIIDN